MAKKKIGEIVEDVATQFLYDNGYELYNVDFVKEGKDWFLRVYIDWQESSEERYISTDDCELVSRYLSGKLDEIDPIQQNYYLEVSSPGLERELIKEKDYARFAGRLAEIKLFHAIDGKKIFTGVLEGLFDGNVRITDDRGDSVELPLKQVAKAKLLILF